MLTWIMRRVLHALGLSAPVKLVRNPKPATLVSLGPDGSKTSTTLDEVLARCPSLFGDRAWYTPTSWLARCVSSSVCASPPSGTPS